MRKEELKNRIEEIKYELETWEINSDDYEEQYASVLDECYGQLSVGSLSWDASYVFRRLDPIGYRCGLLDYVDSLYVTEEDGYKELEKELEELEDELENLNDDN